MKKTVLEAKESIEGAFHGKSEAMFVSAWDYDDDGISEKRKDDILEQLLTAAENNNVPQMKSILSLQPTLIKASDADGYTALHRAAYSNSVDCVNFLISAGASLDARTKDGWTPLHSACNWACYESVGILLSNGADVNSCSNGKLTPLHLAINAQKPLERTCTTVYYLLQAPG
uniref:ANK_REP_REGION domain-containing protein n=1 Tax=Syphacia muris TaxID=451379 RepID=A0A0N5A987_9BILA